MNTIGIVDVSALLACPGLAGLVVPKADLGAVADQIGRKPRQPIRMIVCEAILDRYVLAFDEPNLGQARQECGHKMRGTESCRASEESDHRHRPLLRACRERPRGRRAAEQR